VETDVIGHFEFDCEAMPVRPQQPAKPAAGGRGDVSRRRARIGGGIGVGKRHGVS